MFITSLTLVIYLKLAIFLTFYENIDLLELAFNDVSITLLFVHITIHSIVFSLITYRMYKRKLLFSKQK